MSVKLTPRERVDRAIWNVMHGADGARLTGDFYPGHDAIVDAAMGAFNEALNVGLERALTNLAASLDLEAGDE